MFRSGSNKHIYKQLCVPYGVRQARYQPSENPLLFYRFLNLKKVGNHWSKHLSVIRKLLIPLETIRNQFTSHNFFPKNPINIILSDTRSYKWLLSNIFLQLPWTSHRVNPGAMPPPKEIRLWNRKHWSFIHQWWQGTCGTHSRLMKHEVQVIIRFQIFAQHKIATFLAISPDTMGITSHTTERPTP
jgi:hypothetical protein